MHQTFYIDIDEEITSVVERLRNARDKEIVMVVPKRALLIQSIVNLRLLKKEADGLDRSIMIVTQDKLGKLLIEKAGILVQQKLDDSSEAEIVSDDRMHGKNDLLEDSGAKNQTAHPPGRLARIGSENYFDEPEKEESIKVYESAVEEKKNSGQNSQNKEERLTNRELVANLGQELKEVKKAGAVDLRRKDQKPSSMPSSFDVRGRESFPDPGSHDTGQSFSLPQNTFQNMPPKDWGVQDNVGDSDKKIENFFNHAEPREKISGFPERREEMPSNLSGRAKKFFLVFGLIFVVSIIAVLAYIFAPKATVAITTKTKVKSIDSEVKGDVNATSSDFENDIIPAKVVTVSQEISETFDASGKKSVSNQKARGKVTIYNEFGNSPQPLVATTRLLAENGKLFRLVKGVTVPGTSKVGEETKAGVIEAEVVADEAGPDYNIEPAKFSIPGFKDSGNEKYSKIYAKSTEAMTGGGSGNEETSALTQADIDVAKSKIIPKLNDGLKNKIKEVAGPGAIILDDALSASEPGYKVSNSIGEVADTFEVKAEGSASAVVFFEQDIKDAVAAIIERAGGGKTEDKSRLLTLDYGKAEADMKNGSIIIKVHAASRLNPDIDADNLKKNILGKSNEELETYLGAYPDIEKVDVTYWPSFISGKIPTSESRVEIIID